MPRTRNVQVPQTVLDGPDDVRIEIYFADAASPNPGQARMIATAKTTTGDAVRADRALAETSLTGPQKAQLRNLLTIAFTDILALENFVAQ